MTGRTGGGHGQATSQKWLPNRHLQRQNPTSLWPSMATSKMFRPALYAIVSTNDQQTHAMQNRAMREYVLRRGWTAPCKSRGPLSIGTIDNGPETCQLVGHAKEADFLYLLNATEMNKGTLSSHLTRLEEEGYIRITKTFKGKFPRTICRLLPAGRAAFKIYRKLIRASL